MESKLAKFQGFLVVDAEHRFNGVFASGRAIEVGCNAHGRRKFEDAETTQPVLAVEGGRFLAAAFAAEEEARTAGLVGGVLRDWRQAKVGPLYVQLRHWVHAVEPGLLPDEKLAATIRYYRNHWDALTQWVERRSCRGTSGRGWRGTRGRAGCGRRARRRPT